MNARNKTRNAVHIKRCPRGYEPAGSGVTLVSIDGCNRKIVKSEERREKCGDTLSKPILFVFVERSESQK